MLIVQKSYFGEFGRDLERTESWVWLQESFLTNVWPTVIWLTGRRRGFAMTAHFLNLQLQIFLLLPDGAYLLPLSLLHLQGELYRRYFEQTPGRKVLKVLHLPLALRGPRTETDIVHWSHSRRETVISAGAGCKRSRSFSTRCSGQMEDRCLWESVVATRLLRMKRWGFGMAYQRDRVIQCHRTLQQRRVNLLIQTP